MKTIIQGRNLKITYDVNYKWKTIKNDKGEDITVYIGKPELTKKTELTGWETIAEFDEDIEYNSNCFSASINLSEDEVVRVINKITRIDLKAYVVQTNKTLHEEEIGKEDAEHTLKRQIAEFNKMMIESNEKLLAYCNLHRLVPARTDIDELFKVVYPNQTYRIEDGKLLVNSKVTIKTSGFSYGGSISDDYGVLTTNGVTSAINIYNAR